MMDILRVLVVDDEPGILSGVERVLKNYQFRIPDAEADVSFTIEQATTGEQALAAIEASPPDILLLDHKLPGISGMDVLEQRSPKASDMLIIMITAYASIEIAVKATRQGAYDFLAKPFTPAELRYSIHKAATRLVFARRAKKLAEEKRRVRFEFIRVLGHELKAPIGAVENYLVLLQKKTLGEQVEPYKEIVNRSLIRLDQMKKLIADLLDMTRIESGQRTREITGLNLRECAEHAVEAFKAQAAEHGVTIALRSSGDGLTIQADRTEIDMILNNLISNAVKYNRDQGRVDISLDSRDGLFVIKVEDTGIGMSQDEVARLFKEFTRIKNDKTKRILGSGLGLSILKRLASMYGGDITVQSQPGQGSVFTVTLKDAATAAC